MDEFEKRMNLDGARKAITETINAFNPSVVLSLSKGEQLPEEAIQSYQKKWLDMSARLMNKAESLSQGYADLVINELGLKVYGNPEAVTS